MQIKSKKGKKLPFRVQVGTSGKKLTNLLFACNIETLAKHYTKIANAFMVNNGPKWTCSRLKGYYNIGCKLALELDTDIIPFCRTKGNVPKDMIPFLPFLNSPDLNKRRACLTVLRSYTQIFCQASKETLSIETLGPTELSFSHYEAHFHKVCEKYKIMTKPFLCDEGLFTTSKAGPNGHAMLEVDKDFYALKGTKLLDSIRSLNKEIEDVAKVSNKREISLSHGFCPEFDDVPEEDMINFKPRSERKELMYSAMEDFIQWRLNKEPNCYDDVIVSKLGFLAEGGCKTRVIAIGDYFTQDCLKPIHKSLYKILDQLTTDGTSSHNRIAQVVKERTSKGSLVRSYDLTNATDRFPIFIQQKVLSVMYGPKIASLWKDIMVDREFFVSDNKYVRYGQGQPMGFLSSWAAFALSHHIIIETCASIVGINSFKDYVMIGDDVTIFNERVAKEYEKFLLTFEIEISKAKSLESRGNPSSAEIAKRIFLNGKELSPIPYDALESAIKNYLLFPNLIRLCMERDVQIDITRQQPVQSTLEEVFKTKTASKVLTLLSFPTRVLPFGDYTDIWKESAEQVQTEFNIILKEYITSRAKGLYENELADIPNMGTLGSALESDDGPESLSLHPLFLLLRAYRDRCGSIYQGILIRGLVPDDLKLIPFLVNPLIPNYIRRSHRIERIRSTLILKTYKSLEEKRVKSS